MSTPRAAHRTEEGHPADRASEAAASMSAVFGQKIWRMLDVRAMLALSSAIAVALSWTLYGRGEMSLDEGYTLAESHLPLNQLVEVIWRREMNGSLHTLISWALVNGFNLDSVALIRILSSLFMVAAIWITALIIANLYGNRYAAWAALLFASPLVLQQMVDARTYALTLMLTAVSVWILTSTPEGDSIARVAAWSVVNGLLVYAHFFGLAVIAAECVWLVFQRPRHRRRWILGLGVTVAMSFPLFVFLLSPGAHQHQLLPHPPFDARDYLAQLLALILGDQSKGQRGLQLVAALIIVTVIVVLARTRINRRATYLAAAIALSPPLLGFAMSLSIPSAFGPRYMISSLLGVALLIIGAISAIRSKTWKRAMKAVIVVSFAILIVYTIGTAPSSADLRLRTNAMKLVAQRSSSGAVVTTAVAYEGAVTSHYANAEDLRFEPTPESATTFLAASTYTPRACVRAFQTDPPPELWLVSQMSPDFDAAVREEARCTGLRLVWKETSGTIRIAEFSRR